MFAHAGVRGSYCPVHSHDRLEEEKPFIASKALPSTHDAPVSRGRQVSFS